MIPLLFVTAIIIATIALGIVTTRKAQTASDFFVAGRSVSVFWNASAISGEYLSAASFMGIAGLVMKGGYDALWYPVGYAAGYLFLLLFIAGPLRRFGAYTIPDFAQGRFDSPTFRKIAVTFVLFIGFFYTMPQMKGAGVTMSSILNWPYWAGILVVGSVITFNVALGGMKGITVVQAFQYWAKLFAISVPIFVLLAIFPPHSSTPANDILATSKLPRMTSNKSFAVKGALATPANVIALSDQEREYVLFPEGAILDGVIPGRKMQPGALSASMVLSAGYLEASGQLPPELSGATLVNPAGFPKKGNILIPKNAVLAISPVKSEDGKPNSVKLSFAKPTKIQIYSGDGGHAIAPNAPPQDKWLNPFGPITSKQGFPLLYTYSLIIALVCGTAGLPHILVRFYTNPDGRAAKRTTLWVMVMLGAFYVFTPLWGTLARFNLPDLYANNATDSAVIKLPTIIGNELLGQILSGVTSAGAFAAFMSTFSGLLVSMSGAFAHDIYGKILRPGASDAQRLTAFKGAAIGVGLVSMGLGLLVETFDIATMVGWAFAIGAASYFPLLLLGSWWRGLTKFGAAAGMLLGGFSSLAAIVTSMLLDKKILTMEVAPLLRSLMEQPAIWGVPLSITTMVLVSRATKDQVPADVDIKMLRLHAPEELGYSKDYVN